MKRILMTAIGAGIAFAATEPAAAQGRWQPSTDSALIRRARAIHDRVMTLDTHVDISPNNFRRDTANYSNRLGTQVDLVKMEEGGLDAVFLIEYVGQTDSLNAFGYTRALAQAMEKFAAVHRLVDTLAPTRVGLARTAADARRIYASGKKVVFIGIENAFPVGTDITNVKKFYDLGGRYMSLAHNGHSQLSDSNTGERDNVWLHNGLSPLGRDVVKEMNRLGIMVDFSHPSKQAMMQMLQVTKAPIIGSHSGVRAICNHSRNADDEQLRALKQNGGVIQLVAFNAYVKCNPQRDAERQAATEALRKEFGLPLTGGRGGGRGRGGAGAPDPLTVAVQALPEDKRSAYLTRQEDITRRFPAEPRATVGDFVDHIDHVVKLIGIDHAGISSDFDGGGGVDGWNNASETFSVTLELVRRGYTEQQITKIWSGNLLRVLEECERVARDIQSGKIKA